MIEADIGSLAVKQERTFLHSVEARILHLDVGHVAAVIVGINEEELLALDSGSVV